MKGAEVSDLSDRELWDQYQAKASRGRATYEDVYHEIHEILNRFKRIAEVTDAKHARDIFDGKGK